VNLLEVDPETVGDKKDDLEAKRLVDTLDENLPQAEADRHWHILRAVTVEELAEPLAVTLPKRRGKTLVKTSSYTVKEAVANRLGDTSAMWRPRKWSLRELSVYQRRTLKQLATHNAMKSLTDTKENTEKTKTLRHTRQ